MKKQNCGISEATPDRSIQPLSLVISILNFCMLCMLTIKIMLQWQQQKIFFSSLIIWSCYLVLTLSTWIFSFNLSLIYHASTSKFLENIFQREAIFMSQSLLKSESVPLCRMPGSLQDESMLFLDMDKHGKYGQTWETCTNRLCLEQESCWSLFSTSFGS